MIYLSQRDPRWAADRLGASKLTVGRYGCTTTCISMLSDYFGSFRSPKDLAAVKSHYTKDGLVLWPNMKFDKMQFIRREHGEPSLGSMMNTLNNPKTAVILQVNNGQHWVVALRKSRTSNDYLVLDPWTGTKVWAKAAYHNITGAAFFAAK